MPHMNRRQAGPDTIPPKQTQHTKEPWKIKKKRSKGVVNQPPVIVAENPMPGHGETVCFMGGGAVHYANYEANAKRIVACVNACAGMADPESEIAQFRQDKAELVKAANEVIQQLDSSVNEGRKGASLKRFSGWFCVSNLRAAIAKAPQ